MKEPFFEFSTSAPAGRCAQQRHLYLSYFLSLYLLLYLGALLKRFVAVP